MQLREYLNKLFQSNKKGHKEPLVVDICNKEDGQLCFVGNIEWLTKDFINPNLQFVEHQIIKGKRDIIWFKEEK